MVKKLVKKLSEVYDVEYDEVKKVLWIRQSISVKELKDIKLYLKMYNIELNNLKIGRFVQEDNMNEKDLSRYYKLKLEKDDLEKRIEKLETEIAVIKGGVSAIQMKDNVSSSHSSESNQERLVEMEELLEKLHQQYLDKRISSLEEYIEIEKYINSVDDPEIRTIMRYRNLDLMSWNKIADLISTNEKIVSDSAVKKKYYRYFKENGKMSHMSH